MRAVIFDTYGGPEVLSVGDVPEPHAGPGQVRIKVRAASINTVDCKQRLGQLSEGQPAEGVTQTGVDAAGVVDEVGDGVTGVGIGDEVIGIGQGVQAEYAALVVWVLKPEGLGWNEAGALGLIGETAARGLTLLGIGAGDTVFIDGASGGVGKMAVQLAVPRGARVIGSASANKQDLIVRLGGEPVIYGEGVADRVRKLAGSVDGAFDIAGKTPVEDLIALVNNPAEVVTIANFTAEDTGIQMTGGASGTDPSTSLAEVVDLFRRGELRVEVDMVLPFDQAPEGHRATVADTTKVVLIP